MDPQTIYRASGTANMPYTHCKTRIIDLHEFDIPESATEEEYKKLYDEISRFQTPTARLLTDAVNSISWGIAPPVAFPTETVYGLGADATNRASIAGIFAAKGRPSDNPLIVHVASREHLERLTGEPIPEIYHTLVEKHWPGPLTILVPIPQGKSVFAPNVHPGQNTIGFRVPSSKYARFFIAATGRPIAGPSANSSGKPSPTTPQHVMDDLNGKINFILEGGHCNVGVESTVVDGLHDPPLILRPGGLSQDDLITHGKQHGNSWANVQIGYKQTHTDHGPIANGSGDISEAAPRAPGMKYKHYAPQGQMILFDSSASQQKVQTHLDDLIAAARGPTPNGTTLPKLDHKAPQPLTIAILPSTSWGEFANIPVQKSRKRTSEQVDDTVANPATVVGTYHGHTVHSIRLGTTSEAIAQRLFAALRTCDELNCRFILAEAPQKDDKAHAVMNGVGGGNETRELLHEFDAVLERMRKASSLVVT